ncbi:hydroxylamine reductase [Bacillota bacterium Meth-B3]
MSEMFCFQCEQTARGTGCTGRMGVCGKTDLVADAQDKLTGALIALARAAEGQKPGEQATEAMLEGLFTTVTNVSFDEASIERMTARVLAEADVLGGGDTYDMGALWHAHADVRSLKSLLLLGMRGMAAYAHHARVLGYRDDEVDAFFYTGLRAVADEADAGKLLNLNMELGRVNLICMALLDKANTEQYGTPTPTHVPLAIEPGPFIVISGHDLKDLQLLLEQTKGKGVNIYTHGEMLPAHGYPKLKAYPQLKGNFGTAWQNQQKEFNGMPAPVLFTTNCLMPVKDSYRDRVYTTAMVAYPGLRHIGEDKDFTPIIEQAIALGGYKERHEMTGINGGTSVTTGFGHGAVLKHAAEVVAAVKNGDIRHFFLVGGCDGAKPGRNYYTDFAASSPADTVILTLACGKFRFNDLDLGTVAGLPRLMDMGQCNDAYGAIRVALALSEAFGVGVNELPLTLVLSWYEQKAVVILLTLLHLGIKNIHIGPTLPAFVSEGVLKVLVEQFALTPIGEAKEDLKKILG